MFGRVVDGRLRGVDESGGGDAGARDLLRAVGEPLDHRDDGVLDLLRPARVGGHAVFAHDRRRARRRRLPRSWFRRCRCRSRAQEAFPRGGGWECGAGPRPEDSQPHHLECNQPIRPKPFRPYARPPGIEGATVKQFDTPAIVPADPEANATDLLVDRVAATPDAPAVQPPRTATAGRTSPRPSSSARSSRSRRASSPPASSRATRSA